MYEEYTENRVGTLLLLCAIATLAAAVVIVPAMLNGGKMPFSLQIGAQPTNATSQNTVTSKASAVAPVLSVMVWNLQGTSTQPGFQQMVQFDPSRYWGYEGTDLGNVRFYYGGSELYSWCESGCNSSSNNAVFWVKLPISIGANSSIQISIVFKNTTVNYDGIYAGEAPQLSPVYGEYDNGAKVFDFYSNLDSDSYNEWNWTSGSGYQGLYDSLGTFQNGSVLQPGEQIFSTMNFSPSEPYIMDAYGELTPNPAGAGFEGYFAGFVTNSNNAGYNAQGEVGYLAGRGVQFGLATVNGSVGFPVQPSARYNIWTVGVNQSLVYAEYDYQDKISLPNHNEASGDIGAWAGIGAFEPMKTLWIRVRMYPPDGVMPTATVV